MAQNKFNYIKLLILLLIIGALVIGAYLFISPRIREDDTVMEISGVVELPQPAIRGEISVEESIQQRRSIRNFDDASLDLEELSQILWATQGITDQTQGLRAAPSAGATYPLEVYVVSGSNGIAGLEEGVYRYEPNEHNLEQTLKGDLRSDLRNAALGQDFIGEAPVNIIITGIYERTTARYRDRGIRYVHMEAGHAAQNLYLQVESLGLGTVVVGAFRDDEVRNLLRLGPDQEPLYIIPIGRRI